MEMPEGVLAQLRVELENPDVQVIRADRVAGKEHLMLAASHASKARLEGHKRARSLAMEFLLYTSGQRQIARAIELVGVSRDTRELVVIVFPKNRIDDNKIEEACTGLFGGVRDDSVIEIGSKKKMRGLCDAYGITQRELGAAGLPNESVENTIKRLVVERSALLAID